MTDPGEVARRVARGATWMVLLRFCMRLISVVSQLVLVRLLTPADFGLVAGATAAYAVLDGLTETSMGLAVVQAAQPERALYDSAWTLIVLRGFVVGAAVWAGAPYAAEYLHDPRVAPIMRLLAAVALFQGLESIGMLRLQRDIRFGGIFLYRIASKTAGFLTALPIAILYQSYWALVLGGAAGRIVAVPLSYWIAPHRPRPSLRHVPALMNFSKWLFLNNLLTMADVSLMPMTLGRIGSGQDLGFFRVTSDLAALPASEIAAPVRAPMHAGYARVAGDAPALRRQIYDGLGLVTMLIVPMSFGLAAVAPLLVPVVLGPQWRGADAAMALAAIYTVFDALGHFTGGVYMVRNAQRPYVLTMAACLALRLGLVIPATMQGGLSAAMAAMAVTAVVNAGLWFHFLRPVAGLQWRGLLGATWRTLAAATLMLAAVRASLGFAVHGAPLAEAALQLLAFCAGGAVMHAVAQAALWVACGRPAGAEAQAAAVVSGAVRKMFFFEKKNQKTFVC